MIKFRLNSYIKKNWRDWAAIIFTSLLIVVSIIKDYHLGFLVGFLVLIVSLYFEKIKRIIFDMKIRRIFGIEFGEQEKETIKKDVSEDVQRRGLNLSENDINIVTEAALARIIGPQNKSRFYEETVLYALKDLKISFQQEFSFGYGRSLHTVDFLVEFDDNRVLGIEAIYSDRRYLSRDKIIKTIETSKTLGKVDMLCAFVLITNAEIMEKDKKTLDEQELPIDVIEGTVSPGGVLSRLSQYIQKVKRDNVLGTSTDTDRGKIKKKKVQKGKD